MSGAPDREKVIKGLEVCLESIDSTGCPEECPYYEACQKYEKLVVFQPLMRDALSLLKAQEPRVMTLEEVKQHNNQDGCVWFELPTYNANASFAIQDDECTEIISPYILGETINHGYWLNRNYNRTWRCWTSRPTDEQRKAVKWDG